MNVQNTYYKSHIKSSFIMNKVKTPKKDCAQ